MSVRPYRDIVRRRTRQIHVGPVAVGGDAPITVQSMTNTPTTDVAATVAQIGDLVAAGADIVRVSCPDRESTSALRDIVARAGVPIVADIHFHYQRAIEAAQAGAAWPAHQSRQYRLRRPGAGGRDRRTRSRCQHADRRQRRVARARPAREVRRAVPRGDGRERPQSRPSCSRTTAFSISRSASRHPTCSSRLPPTNSSPMPVSTRFISASPKPAGC